MKKALQVSLLAILLSSISIVSHADPVPCPSLDQIRQAEFIIARDNMGFWVLRSLPFTDENNNKWNVSAVMLKLPFQTERDSVQQTNDLIKSFPLVPPHEEGDAGQIRCAYHNKYSPIWVAASNPPVYSDKLSSWEHAAKKALAKK